MQLSKFASSQPHVAYSAMIHGLSSRWTFLSRTVNDLSFFLAKLFSFDCAIFHRQRDLKEEALSIKHQRLTDNLSTSSSTLPPNLQLSLKLASEKGASSWLSTLPLECHGFAS